MKRTDFLKALVVVPFAPAILAKLKPEPPTWVDTGSIGVVRVRDALSQYGMMDKRLTDITLAYFRDDAWRFTGSAWPKMPG